MTQQEKRIKIAEACGWKMLDGKEYKWEDPSGHIFEDWSKRGVMCPDYFNDLNEMHSAEEVILKQGLQDCWSDTLVEVVVGENIHWSDYHCFPQVTRATAAQRAEAFGKTLNLW
jgi:hypothetical protein